GDSMLFSYTKSANAKPQTSSEVLRRDALINDMVAPFLTSHWDALMKGQTVKSRHIVVPRRETIGFSFVKFTETTRRGEPVVIIKMEATSPLIAAVVDPLIFVMEKTGKRHILEYVGRTTPKIREGNKWKDLDAV